jgi:dUTP pyrophosphatase
MRIAQLVVAPVVTVRWRETTNLGETARADGGFGSTGSTGGSDVAGVVVGKA